MSNSIQSTTRKSYSLILLAVTLLTATGFMAVYFVNENNQKLAKTVLPKKEALTAYISVVNEFELLWQQSDDFFNPYGLSKRNKFKGLTEVVFPNLNRKVYYNCENLPIDDEYFINSKKMIYHGEELIRLSNKLLTSKNKTRSLRLDMNDNLIKLKELIGKKTVYTTNLEQQLKIQLDQNIIYITIASILIAVFSFIIVFKALILQRKSIILPITELTHQISKFGYAQYGQEYKFGELEEFQKLGDAFTQLSKESKSNFNAITKSIKRLKSTTKELEESNEQLEEFAYIASHDLKTPVRGLKNLAMFIKEDYMDSLDQEGKKMLDQMENSAKKINDLIDDLLLYSKVSKTEIESTQINLNATIEKVIQYLDFDQDRNIKIITKELPTIKGDASKIASVFTNLFTNAAKYNKSEIKEISIWSEEGKVFFKDNGIGIEESDYNTVFAFFKRAHANEFEGTGAGMAIVKKILDRHNAPITINSKVGEGTTFIVDFSECLD